METPTPVPPSPTRTPGWTFRIAVIAVIGVSLAAGAYFYVKARRASRPPSTLDQPLGVRRVPGVEESGFYGTEGGQTVTPFRWTNGTARLVVPVDGPAPVSLHVRLGLGVPKPTKLAIRVNGTPLFNETVKAQADWVRTFDLAGIVADGPVTIEILSDTFIPSQVKKGGKDDRTLGVNVRGITLISGSRDVAGVNLAAEPIPGLEESGFHNREQCGSQPCRWTNGKAQVVVPVPTERKWKAIAVTAEIPDRPDYRVRLAVNGRRLFDGVVKSGRTWAQEFPLDGIELGGRATIELSSSTHVPSQSKGDNRTLGIRVLKLMLVGG